MKKGQILAAIILLLTGVMFSFGLQSWLELNISWSGDYNKWIRAFCEEILLLPFMAIILLVAINGRVVKEESKEESLTDQSVSLKNNRLKSDLPHIESVTIKEIDNVIKALNNSQNAMPDIIFPALFATKSIIAISQIIEVFEDLEAYIRNDVKMLLNITSDLKHKLTLDNDEKLNPTYHAHLMHRIELIETIYLPRLGVNNDAIIQTEITK